VISRRDSPLTNKSCSTGQSYSYSYSYSYSKETWWQNRISTTNDSMFIAIFPGSTLECASIHSVLRVCDAIGEQPKRGGKRVRVPRS